MRRIPIRLVAGLLLGTCVAVFAADGHNRYRWHDADGALHYGDVLPAEATRFGYDVLSAQGIVIKHVERAKTPAERAAAEALAKRAEDARQSAERQQRDDRQMLASYPTETDLVRSHELELELLDNKLDALRVELASIERLLGEQLDAAADYERDKQPVPVKLGAQIGELRKRVSDQRDYIGRREVERAAAVERFAAELARYRSLRAASR